MAGLIPPEILDEIQTRSDIVEVISTYVPLKKAGGNSWKGCCPFHNEKTPSFHVRGDKQVFYCFGCHKGGNVFKFVMEKEGITFPEAAHLLAGRCGVGIPDNTPGADPHAARAAANTRERMYQLNEEFARFFEHELHDHPDSPAAKYLATRQLPPDVIQKFRLGAAPDGWDSGLKFGRSLGFSEQEMLQAGLLRHNEERGRIYDLFRSRLTFAIWNDAGKVVGFSARMLGSDPTVPKYVNTPETPVFKKGHILYALPFAREAMNKTAQAILCEGQLDTIALHRAGFTQAMAPQGTGFTPDQARLLRRYDVRQVLLAFDSDNAGQKAIRAALEILLPLEMEVRVIRIPGGKDPDELLRTAGPEAVKSAVTNSISWLEYLGDFFAGNYDLRTAAGTGRAVEELGGLILSVENPVLREFYIRDGAAMLHVGQDTLEAELERRTRMTRRRFTPAAPASQAQPARQDLRKETMFTLLELALSEESAARELAELLPAEEFHQGLPDQALNQVLAMAVNGEFTDAPTAVTAMLNGADPEADSRISAMLAAETGPFATPRLKKKAMQECLGNLQRLQTTRSQGEILNELRQTRDPARRMELLAELSKKK